MNHWKAVIEALGAQLETKEWDIGNLEEKIEGLKEKIAELESENQALRMKLMDPSAQGISTFVPKTTHETV